MRIWKASIVRFGAAVLVAIAGLICTLAFDSTVGIAVGVALLGLGVIATVSLVFYEIGLSEDRDRRRHPRG